MPYMVEAAGKEHNRSTTAGYPGCGRHVRMSARTIGPRPQARCTRCDRECRRGTMRQEIALQRGIPIETAREFVKFVKEHKLKKVQVSIQAERSSPAPPRATSFRT